MLPACVKRTAGRSGSFTRPIKVARRNPTIWQPEFNVSRQPPMPNAPWVALSGKNPDQKKRINHLFTKLL
jgi:hypothetical protein